MRLIACAVVVMTAACVDTAAGEFVPSSGQTSSTSGMAPPLEDSSSQSTAAPADSSEGATPPGPKFDLAQSDPCVDAQAGIRCSEGNAVECDADGNEVDVESCAPGVCVDAVGCVVCVEGQVTCAGNKVKVCDTSVDPPKWEVIEVCDPAAAEACSVELVACTASEPVGGTTPTGEYFQFADFETGQDGFLGGYDVDGFDDRLYVHRTNHTVDVYRIELLDSDGDGVPEPNQHPDNPDEPGPIEARALSFVETIDIDGGFQPSASELFATEDGIVIGGQQLVDNPFGGPSQVISELPPWVGVMFEQIGFDEGAGVWYASNQQARRVLQRDAEDGEWGIAFDYPVLVGGHMDGLEVVSDPETNIVYVYVSDMTSDFLAQYRFDAEAGWVQENLFSYAGTTGVPVEGMGFGPLRHFWATGAGRLYELGGGDLSTYTEPAG